MCGYLGECERAHACVMVVAMGPATVVVDGGGDGDGLAATVGGVVTHAKDAPCLTFPVDSGVGSQSIATVPPIIAAKMKLRYNSESRSILHASRISSICSFSAFTF